ncbi:LLM class flavin-dependent oxidoreductase [Zavarzinia compransoris]|uniref:LLM class flavin-dependent oxidoreductase n=1 Tax=Zavarzinia compransoris TaxID=1264899 RepID=A0A317DTW4_9PROT|nr:LLM class flavin-dependent oxidoreductase [Zavarzinia compransoris]PWR17814.1 LLM class flavin-dependent oxidoreductase [Zavarzinia compransoris]TDP49347.1 FMNH2-dependent dimethyl sulfone monooxygenase [Zavarzinia compransoris]
MSIITPAREDQAPLARLQAQPLVLGLFLPLYAGGWTVSDAPRGTDWTFDYNARLVARAEAIGFDLAFGFANWLGKDGFGGRTRFRANSLDSLASSAALAARTSRIVLLSTVHALYGWHPLNLARIGATLDHITGGRWGANLVTGFLQGEADKFGQAPIAHDERYRLLDEFSTIVEKLWTEDEELDFQGARWSLKGAYVSPRPAHRRPLLVSAASSDAGFRYAARHSDLVFITSPAGAAIEAALDVLPAVNARLKAYAAEEGRRLQTIINPHIIARDSTAEVEAVHRRIVEGADEAALTAFVEGFSGGDSKSWSGHRREQRIIGGNIQIFGTPEQVVEQCLRLKAAGCDGIQVNFFDYEPDLEFFGARILPLLRQAGLRH